LPDVETLIMPKKLFGYPRTINASIKGWELHLTPGYLRGTDFILLWRFEYLETRLGNDHDECDGYKVKVDETRSTPVKSSTNI
jgi:hypothetical protein